VRRVSRGSTRACGDQKNPEPKKRKETPNEDSEVREHRSGETRKEAPNGISQEDKKGKRAHPCPKGYRNLALKKQQH
jgi:hypothetical protein